MNRLLTLATQARCFPVLLFMLAATGPLSQAQTVQITSPAQGAVFHPGQTMVVTVDATPLAFKTVIVVGICRSDSAKSSPCRRTGFGC